MQSNFNNKKQSIRQNLAKDPVYSTGTLAQLLSKFKIHKKSKFDQNELKLSKQD